MKRYAEVMNNVVRHIFDVTTNHVPEFAPPLQVVDITTVNPQPKEGWTYSNGVFSKPETPKILYINVTLSEGDGIDPIGIVNNGTDYIAVSGSIKYNNEIIPLTGSWRITIRGSDGNIYDIVLVSITNGEFSFNYTTTNKPEICSVKDSDFESIIFNNETYEVKLANPFVFKVYRAL